MHQQWKQGVCRIIAFQPCELERSASSRATAMQHAKVMDVLTGTSKLVPLVGEQDASQTTGRQA